MDKPQVGFEELVVRYQSVVCAVAYAVLRDRARSEEVAQDAFLIAWQKLPAMEVPPAMPGWLCGIARNLAANAARRRKEPAMETEPVTDGTPLDAVLDREADELARRALASLKDQDREAVVLYYRGDGDTSMADVASTLGITEAAARQRVHRGRERLRAALGAVETTLRATRPGPAFTAACVTALATRGTTSTAAAASTKSAAWPLAAVAGLAGIVAVAQAASTGSPPETGGLASASIVEQRSPATDTVTTTKPRELAAPLRTIDARTKRELVERIRGARIRRTAAENPGIASTPPKTMVYDFSGGALAGPLAAPPKDLTVLNKATLRHAIQLVQPMLLECYGAAYDRLPRKAGTITVQLHLEGEPGVATVVESATLGGDLVSDPELAECFEQTLLSIELAPMPAGGAIDLNYPFTVSGVKP